MALNPRPNRINSLGHGRRNVPRGGECVELYDINDQNDQGLDWLKGTHEPSR